MSGFFRKGIILALFGGSMAFLLFVLSLHSQSLFHAFTPPLSPSIDPEMCCVCIYREIPECADYTQDECEEKECSDDKDNDGDGLTDKKDPECADGNGVYWWFDVSESKSGTQKRDCVRSGAQCTSQFEERCRALLKEQPQCKSQLVIPETDDLKDHQDFLKACTVVQLFHVSHGTAMQCQDFFQEVNACLTCATPKCKKVLASHTGCRLFQNQEEVRKWAAKLQSLLLPDETLELSAPQTISSAACKTTLTVTITSKKVSFAYGKCHADGAFCYGTSSAVSCSDAQGNVAKEICCKKKDGNGYEWKRADACP